MIGSAYCWGEGGEGELGDGDYLDRGAPALVVGGASYTQLSAGNTTTCAVQTTGALACWGDNTFGQLGNGTSSSNNVPTPVRLAGASKTPQQVAVGDHFACERDAIGGVYCWGDNSRGALGIGVLGRSTTPQVVPLP
jgi:hypothetical protein